MYRRSHTEEYLISHHAELAALAATAEQLAGVEDAEWSETNNQVRVKSLSHRFSRTGLAVLTVKSYKGRYGVNPPDLRINGNANLTVPSCQVRRAEFIGGLGIKIAVSEATMTLPGTDYTGTGYLITEESAGVGQETHLALADGNVYAAEARTGPVYTDEQGWTVVRAGSYLNFTAVDSMMVAAAAEPDCWRVRYRETLSYNGPAATEKALAVIAMHSNLMRTSEIPLEFGSGAPSMNQLTHTWYNLSELEPLHVAGADAQATRAA